MDKFSELLEQYEDDIIGILENQFHEEDIDAEAVTSFFAEHLTPALELLIADCFHLANEGHELPDKMARWTTIVAANGRVD